MEGKLDEEIEFILGNNLKCKGTILKISYLIKGKTDSGDGIETTIEVESDKLNPFDNCKIFITNEKESKEIQELLFGLGYRWYDADSPAEAVAYYNCGVDEYYISINKDKTISLDDYEKYKVITKADLCGGKK